MAAIGVHVAHRPEGHPVPASLITAQSWKVDQPSGTLNLSWALELLPSGRSSTDETVPTDGRIDRWSRITRMGNAISKAAAAATRA